MFKCYYREHCKKEESVVLREEEKVLLVKARNSTARAKMVKLPGLRMSWRER